MILNKIFYKKYKINLEKPGSPLILLIKRDAYHALALLCTIIKNQDGSIKTKEQIDQLIDFLKKEENRVIKKKFLNELKKSFYTERSNSVKNRKNNAVILYSDSVISNEKVDQSYFLKKKENQKVKKTIFSSASHVYLYILSIVKQHGLYDDDRIVSFMHMHLQNKHMLDGQRMIFRIERLFFAIKSLEYSQKPSFWKKILINLKRTVTVKNKFQKEDGFVYDNEAMQAFNSIIYETEHRIASASLQNPVVSEFTWQLYVLQLAYLSEVFRVIIKNFSIDTIATAVVEPVEQKFVYETLQDVKVSQFFSDVEHFLFIHYRISKLFNKDEETALRVVVFIIQQFKEFGVKRDKEFTEGQEFSPIKKTKAFDELYIKSHFAKIIDEKFFDKIDHLLQFQQDQEDVIGNFLWPDSVEDVTNSIFTDFIVAFINAFINQFF